MKVILTILVGMVLLSGLFISSTYSLDAYAAPSEKGQEKGKASGCENGTAKNNKHCDSNGSGGLPTNTCDTNNDGALSVDELDGFSQEFINLIEQQAGTTNPNGVIDTTAEWNVLQDLRPGICT